MTSSVQDSAAQANAVLGSKTLALLARPRFALMFALGFSAGLPLLLYYSTLSYRLRQGGFDTGFIAFFTVFGLAWAFKFLWAPFLDRYDPPGFGRLFGKRRGWMITAQLGVIAGLIGLGIFDPVQHIAIAAFSSFLVAFSSATQDIAIDGWRIEATPHPDDQALMASMYQYGYRVAMWIAAAGAFFIAGYAGWPASYLSMAAFMLVGCVAAVIALEPAWGGPKPPRPAAFAPNVAAGLGFVALCVGVLALLGVLIAFLGASGLEAVGFTLDDGLSREESSTLKNSVALAAIPLALAPICLSAAALPLIRRLPAESSWRTHALTGPFVDFFHRYGWIALFALAFMASYRLSDLVMGVQANVFYADKGYSEEAIGLVAKTWGLPVTLAGIGAGGFAALRFGLTASLVVGAVISVLGNLVFAWLAAAPDAALWRLAAAIAADNFAGGFAGTVLIAFLSALTSSAFAGSQYAFFSSMFMLTPKIVGMTSGVMQEHLGWTGFFVVAGLLGAPAIIMSFWAGRMRPAERPLPAENT